jgi:peroxiredoxin
VKLEALYKDLRKGGVLVVGIAHRGDAQAARAFAERLKLSFPVLVGTGWEIAKQFAAGKGQLTRSRYVAVVAVRHSLEIRKIGKPSVRQRVIWLGRCITLDAA